MITRLLIFLAVLCAARVQAFVVTTDGSGNIQRWDLAGTVAGVPTNSVNTNLHAVRYYISSDAWSTTNTAAEINAVRACFAQWQAIPGTGLKFEEVGLIGPGVGIDTTDHTNVIYWVKGTTVVNGADSIAGALGLTFTLFTSENVLLEADIVLNGHEYNWFTDLADTNNAGFHVEGTLLHEIGHFVGLRHSPVGGATMLALGGSGSQAVQIGLSEDEFAAARFLYPTNPPQSLGTVKGTITKNGSAVLGAAIFVETAAGNVIVGTVSEQDGSYAMPALRPGSYTVRVTPLDSTSVSQWLVNGFDIDAAYGAADTDFLPTAPVSVTVTGGVTNTQNFAVTDGTPQFYISNIRTPTNNPAVFGAVNSPVSVRPGQSNITVGIYGPTLPTNGMSLVVTGDGISHSSITYVTNIFGSLNCVSVIIGVASNATPGLRSFVATHTNDSKVAWANGFIEVSPLLLDQNFDGLDDMFQRKYFPLFTSAQAAPATDADGDGYTNLAEYIAGSNPTNSASFLQIQSVTQNVSGTTVTWTSEAGKKYQILSRSQITGSPWTTNTTVIGSGATTQHTDPVSGAVKFYRIQAVP